MIKFPPKMPNFAQKIGCKSYFAHNLYKNFTFCSETRIGTCWKFIFEVPKQLKMGITLKWM
tara:strand:+ start:496 stop:678 length:183 start_codon:yes stop_codon:yes gene_type:complete